MSKVRLATKAIKCPNGGRTKYQYLYECRVCTVQYWSQASYKEPPRCRSCAGRQTYTPSKVDRADIRKRGDGYITKQGYHLVYDGTGYVPAHRLAFPDLPPSMVVHHIDGDKLNNDLSNLVPLSRADHRRAHSSLEDQAFVLIQKGLITYDATTNTYSLSSSMKKLIELIPVNSGEPQTDGAVGNPEPSQPHEVGRCNDYPLEEYARSLVEARDTQTDNAEG